MTEVKERTNYLKGSIVRDFAISKLKILSEAEYVTKEITDKVTNQKKTREVLQCQVEANDQMKTKFVYEPNVTSERYLSEKLGKDTKSWIGAVLDVRTNPTPTGLGILITDAHGAVLA